MKLAALALIAGPVAMTFGLTLETPADDSPGHAEVYPTTAPPASGASATVDGGVDGCGASPTDPELRCGSVTPRLSVRCTEHPVTAYSDRPSVDLGCMRTAPEDLTAPEVCRDTEAKLEVTCRTEEETPQRKVKSYVLSAKARGRGGVGADGSDGQVRPTWTIPVNVPKGKWTLHYDAVLDHAGSACKLRIGGDRVVDVGTTKIMGDVPLNAPAYVLVTVDCEGKWGENGLAVVGGWGGATPPPVNAKLDLRLSLRAPAAD